MKTTKTLLLSAFLCLFCLNHLFAQETKKSGSPLRLLITSALELGGDEVAKVYFTNGNTQSVKAGQGISFGVGGQLQIPGVEKFLVRATAGLKYVTTAADNAHIRLTRIPLHFTANWMATNRIRLGAGLAMHRNIRFKADGIGRDVEFDGASGPIFEVAYRGVGLTYTAMTYKDDAKYTYAANAIGLSFSLVIPNK